MRTSIFEVNSNPTEATKSGSLAISFANFGQPAGKGLIRLIKVRLK